AILVKQFVFSSLPGSLSLAPNARRPVEIEAEVEAPVPENAHAALASLIQPKSQARLSLIPGDSATLPITSQVTHAMASLPGENTLSLNVRPIDGTPLQIKRAVWASENQFSHEPYGDYEARRREALEHLAQMPYDVPASMAAVELGKASIIDSEA